MVQRAGVDYLHYTKASAGIRTLYCTVLSLVAILVGSCSEVAHIMTNSVKIWIPIYDIILSLSLYLHTHTLPYMTQYSFSIHISPHSRSPIHDTILSLSLSLSLYLHTHTLLYMKQYSLSLSLSISTLTLSYTWHSTLYLHTHTLLYMTQYSLSLSPLSHSPIHDTILSLSLSLSLYIHTHSLLYMTQYSLSLSSLPLSLSLSLTNSPHAEEKSFVPCRPTSH